jgi:hypothetical protein
MDAPDNAQAGVEGANRMFATGTPNPLCSKEKIFQIFSFGTRKEKLCFSFLVQGFLSGLN